METPEETPVPGNLHSNAARRMMAGADRLRRSVRRGTDKRIASPNDSGNCFPERKRSTTGRNHRPLDVCGSLFQTLSFYARPPSGFLFAAEYCESSVDSSVFFFCPSRGEAVLKLCGVFFPYCIFPMSGSCPASHERGGPAD